MRTWISCRRSGDKSAKSSPAGSAAGDSASRAGDITSVPLLSLLSLLAGAGAAASPSLGPASAASLLFGAPAAAARLARRSTARRAAVCV